MVHFAATVALRGETPFDDLDRTLAAAPAPFDEEIEVPRYVEFTRLELIAHAKKAYHPRHLEWLQNFADA
ncbi:hypothetical protein [Nocardia tengchongensis]